MQVICFWEGGGGIKTYVIRADYCSEIVVLEGRVPVSVAGRLSLYIFSFSFLPSLPRQILV